MTEVQPMTSSMRPVPDGVSELEFAQLLEAGRKRGYLTQEDLVEVLRTVELSHDVIADAVLAVRAAGIRYVEEVQEDPDVVVAAGSDLAAVQVEANSRSTRTALDSPEVP